jgi:hypothetical protein
MRSINPMPPPQTNIQFTNKSQKKTQPPPPKKKKKKKKKQRHVFGFLHPWIPASSVCVWVGVEEGSVYSFTDETEQKF